MNGMLKKKVAKLNALLEAVVSDDPARIAGLLDHPVHFYETKDLYLYFILRGIDKPSTYLKEINASDMVEVITFLGATAEKDIEELSKEYAGAPGLDSLSQDISADTEEKKRLLLLIDGILFMSSMEKNLSRQRILFDLAIFFGGFLNDRIYMEYCTERGNNFNPLNIVNDCFDESLSFLKTEINTTLDKVLSLMDPTVDLDAVNDLRGPITVGSAFSKTKIGEWNVVVPRKTALFRLDVDLREFFPDDYHSEDLDRAIPTLEINLADDAVRPATSPDDFIGKMLFVTAVLAGCESDEAPNILFILRQFMENLSGSIGTVLKETVKEKLPGAVIKNLVAQLAERHEEAYRLVQTKVSKVFDEVAALDKHVRQDGILFPVEHNGEELAFHLKGDCLGWKEDMKSYLLTPEFDLNMLQNSEVYREVIKNHVEIINKIIDVLMDMKREKEQDILDIGLSL